MTISVIIPLAGNETAWRNLLPDLFAALPDGSEIILALPQNAEALNIDCTRRSLLIHQVFEGAGRAEQMNAAARRSQGAHLWFLHADSRLARDVIYALLYKMTEQPDCLLFADLAFLDDASPLMKLNEIGAWFRSRFLGMPFGDQGLCLRKEIFQKLGGYPENVSYGEDHVFVWRARQGGVRLCPIKAKIFTSARKYRDKGWARTTAAHMYLTFVQAVPEWVKLVCRGNKS